MLYGIETVKGAHFRRVALGTNTARQGLLGKGAILMLTAYPNRTSPVLRGAWILDRLLGTPPADPPLNVPSLPENRRGQPAKTLRARLEQHRANPTCFACHGVMDPLGFAMENFNAVGQYRTNDPDTQTPIDASGQLPDGTPLKGLEDLKRQLVARPDRQFMQTFTENLLTYALGRSLDYRDMPTVRRIVHDAAADDYRFKSIVLGVVKSDAFRKREGDRDRTLQTASLATRRPIDHVSEPKASVAAHHPEGRRRDHRAAAARRDDSGRHRAGTDRRRSHLAPGFHLFPARRAAGSVDAGRHRPRLRLPVHHQAARAVPRLRHRGQRPAQQGRRELEPARHHRRNLAQLREPAQARREDRRGRDGGPDCGEAPGQGHVAAVDGAVRRAGRHDLVPHAGPAAADGEQPAQGVLLDVRAGRYQPGTRSHSEDDREPARLRARVDGAPDSQARRQRQGQSDRISRFRARDRGARTEARRERPVAARRHPRSAARSARRISASCSTFSSR